MIQSSQPFIVTIVPEPTRTTTIGDVILASLGLAGVMILGAILLGVVVALGLILWRKRHPPEFERMPSITPGTPLRPPSTQAQ